MKQTKMNIGIIKCLVLIATGFYMLSCGKENSEILTDYFELPTFNIIELNDAFDVSIREGDDFSLQIKGARDVVEDVSYTIVDERLIMDNKNFNLWAHPKNEPPELVITCKGLTRIDVNETCNLKSLNPIKADLFGIILRAKLNMANLLLDCSSFYYWNPALSGGFLTLSGKAAYVQIYNNNLMVVDASQLLSEYSTVRTSAKTDIQVNVSRRLDYSITGSGNIYLSGNPYEIIIGELTSTGRLIQ